MRPSPPILQCLRPQCLSFPDSSRVFCVTEKKTWQDFCSKLMQSRLVFCRNRVIFDHCSKRYYWSVKKHSEPFIWCLPIRQEILNVSQIVATFHGIRPPFVTQTGPQWHRRCPFLHSAHCSFSNPILFLFCVV